MASITARSDSFSPHMPPPASHAPKPTTEISGPWLPSFRISTNEVAFRRGIPAGAAPGEPLDSKAIMVSISLCPPGETGRRRPDCAGVGIGEWGNEERRSLDQRADPSPADGRVRAALRRMRAEALPLQPRPTLLAAHHRLALARAFGETAVLASARAGLLPDLARLDEG